MVDVGEGLSFSHPGQMEITSPPVIARDVLVVICGQRQRACRRRGDVDELEPTAACGGELLRSVFTVCVRLAQRMDQVRRHREIDE